MLKLQRQVEHLEAALAAISQTKERRTVRRRVGIAMLVCAATAITSVAIPLASGASPNFQGEKMGPLNVTAPFIVVDNKGQRLFAVTANPSGGTARETFARMAKKEFWVWAPSIPLIESQKIPAR
ncbi:MAG: hypothetical protein DMF73_14560 [Acidobacteria bacterium]|nr:MAG: hypothetical protein DMF73_14560 [Acidobacteriota bacterium]